MKGFALCSYNNKATHLSVLQVEKVIQLYKTMLVRHGVMQVGGTSGGKTTARTMLAHALAKFSNIPPQFNQNAPAQVAFNSGQICY